MKRIILILVLGISLDDHTLYFDTPCDGCSLNIVDENDVVVYTLVIPSVLHRWYFRQSSLAIIPSKSSVETTSFEARLTYCRYF